MNITLCSAFRNATGYIDRYFRQIIALNQAMEAREDALYLVIGEGDSTDDTRNELSEGLFALYLEQFIDSDIIDVTHGGPEYGSVVDAQRFKQCAYAGNLVWAQIPDDADVVAWVDSDIIWAPDVLLALIDHTQQYPAIAPMIMLERDNFPVGSFYNVYDFRIDGVHFTQQPPYHNAWRADSVIQVDSAGSVLVMRAELARKVKFMEQDVVIGMCRGIYSEGGSVWLDTSLIARHL